MRYNRLDIRPLEEGDGRSIRALVAGDDAYRKSIAAVLASEVALVEFAESGPALIEKAISGGYDCIVVDKTVGKQNTLELHEIIDKKCRDAPPMILLTDDGSQKTILKAFRNGLSDVVAKDGDFTKELVNAIRRAVERGRQARKLYEEVDYLARLARYDRLTGLPNRNFLEDRLANLIASGERHGSRFALILIDVNNFKKINDIHGHAVGDQVLKAFARQLMLTSRTSDTFGRFGGDEFLYLIDRSVSDEAVELACSRLTNALSFTVEFDEVGLSLSSSIGAAFFPSDGTTPDELLTAADRAMVTAKANGGGHCLAGGLPTGDAAIASQTVVLSLDGADGAADADADDLADRHREENRRVEHRHRVFKRGRIIFGDGFSTIDCVIRDLSARGARITVEDQIAVPTNFSFALLDAGTVFTAMRRWQRGRSIGIEFVADATSRRRPAQRDANGAGVETT